MAAAPEGAKQGPAAILLVAALALVLAWQLAYWTWQFAAPARSMPLAPSASAAVDPAAIAKLFGADASGAAGNSGVDGMVLKGVVAPTPGTAASAIFAPRAGRDVSIFIGEDVRPGVKLVEVDPDHVIVSRAGVRERIDLAAPRSSPAARSAAMPRGFHIDIARTGANRYSLSRAQLDQALRDPSQLQYLGQIAMPPGGGVQMAAAPPGSLAAKLGLQPGDVIRKVNGQPVGSTGDLARLYQEFATLHQIQAEVRRGNTTVELAYQIR